MSYYNSSQSISSLVINLPKSQCNALFGNSTKAQETENTITLEKAFHIAGNTVLCMVVAIILITAIYLPLQQENNTLLRNTERLSNQNFTLTAKAQEVSTYEKLFKNAAALALNEPEKILHLQENNYLISSARQNKNSDKYTTVYFSGF